jgi:polysaccharide biosynthesis transport protein
MELNMNAAATLTLVDYYNIAVRRKWLILGIILFALGAAWILCLVLPKSYLSSTLILVENQKIPEDYVKAIVGGSIEERLTLIQQQVMSRTLLSHVIDEFKLYQDDIRREGLETAIEDMRQHTKVETVGTTGAKGKSVEAFSISFTHENPITAMKVTARLASQFIEENLKVREQLVEGVSTFLEQELNLAKARLETQEQAISQFKAKQMGILPQQMEANLRALDRLQADMTSATEMFHSLTERLGMIEKSIKEYEVTGTTNPSVAVSHGGPDPLVLRLRELKRNLATLSAEYKETYPDLPQVRQEIEKIKTQLAEKYGETDQEADSDTTKTFDPYVQELIKQRNEAKLHLATLKERRLRLAAQLKEYERRVEQTPAREQELMILLRDYENMQKNYQSLLDKKLNARVAENLERRQKGEQFRILDPANLPEKPAKPDRLLIMLYGLAVGGGLGFGAAMLVEQFSPTFRRPEDTEILLDLPVLTAIPAFQLAYKRSSKSNLVASPTGEATLPDKWRPKGLLFSWLKSRNGSAGSGQRSLALLPPSLNLVAKLSPTSVVTEQFRVAATRLALMKAERNNTTVVVTSAVKGEGKSSVVANLGYVLARDLGRPTLLVDCDLKSPMLHKYISVPAGPGLAEFLQGAQSLDSCLHHIGDLPLWIVPSGTAGERKVELSQVHQLNDTLGELRSRFDYIFLDAPPILPLADMHVLAGMADILMLVIRAAATRQDLVLKALNVLRPTVQSVIILTGLEPDGMPYYMYDDYHVRHGDPQHSEEMR